MDHYAQKVAFIDEEDMFLTIGSQELQLEPLLGFKMPDAFLYLSSLQGHEYTVLQSGSDSIDTMGDQPPSGHSVCCCMTWCVATSPLNMTRRS